MTVRWFSWLAALAAVGYLAFGALVPPAPLPLPAGAHNLDPGMRVLLTEPRHAADGRWVEVDLVTLVPCELTAPLSASREQIPAGTRLLIRCEGTQGLVVNNDRVWKTTELILTPSRRQPALPDLDATSQLQQIEMQEGVQRQPTVQIGDRRLRGSLLFHRLDTERLALVNALPIEAWVTGVLAGECSAAWAPEALNAVAITARSYAVSRLRDGPRLAGAGEPSVPFHVRDRPAHPLGSDPHYAGAQGLWPAAVWAVARSRGVILVSQGVGFAALLHRASGGRRADPDVVLPGATAADGRQPLAAIMPPTPDPWSEPGCALLGHPEWHQRHQEWHDLAQLNNELKRRFGEIAGDWTVTRGSHGRIRGGSFISLHNRDAVTVAAWEFLTILQAAGLAVPSTWWDADSPQRLAASEGQPFTRYRVRRFGHGHGLGLSLASAAAQAHAGWRHDEILAAAFSGCRLLRQW